MAKIVDCVERMLQFKQRCPDAEFDLKPSLFTARVPGRDEPFRSLSLCNLMDRLERWAAERAMAGPLSGAGPAGYPGVAGARASGPRGVGDREHCAPRRGHCPPARRPHPRKMRSRETCEPGDHGLPTGTDPSTQAEPPAVQPSVNVTVTDVPPGPEVTFISSASPCATHSPWPGSYSHWSAAMPGKPGFPLS